MAMRTELVENLSPESLEVVLKLSQVVCLKSESKNYGGGPAVAVVVLRRRSQTATFEIYQSLV